MQELPDSKALYCVRFFISAHSPARRRFLAPTNLSHIKGLPLGLEDFFCLLELWHEILHCTVVQVGIGECSYVSKSSPMDMLSRVVDCRL